MTTWVFPNCSPFDTDESLRESAEPTMTRPAKMDVTTAAASVRFIMISRVHFQEGKATSYNCNGHTTRTSTFRTMLGHEWREIFAGYRSEGLSISNEQPHEDTRNLEEMCENRR